MEVKEIEEKIREFLIDEFEIAPGKIAPEADLRKDLGIDSLDIVDIVVMVDSVFGIKIKSEDFKGLRTLGDFTGFIADRI